jgi:hypothetical protein
MEHRWSIRKPIHGGITFTLSPWDKVQTNICNVSLGGLATTNQQRLIPVNTIATLSFSLEYDGCVSYHHLHAQVAHCDAACIGFLFVEPGDETLHVLRDMLYSPASRLAASIAGQSFAA